MTKAVTIINADQNEEKTVVVQVFDRGAVTDVGTAPDTMRQQTVLVHPGDDVTIHLHNSNYLIITEREQTGVQG